MQSCGNIHCMVWELKAFLSICIHATDMLTLWGRSPAVRERELSLPVGGEGFWRAGSSGLSFFKAIISIALLVKMLGNSSGQRTNVNLIKTRTKADLLFFLSMISLSSLQRSCMDYVTGCRVCCAREVVKPNIDMPLKSKHSKQKGWNGRRGDVQGEGKSQEINYRGSSRVYRQMVGSATFSPSSCC